MNKSRPPLPNTFILGAAKAGTSTLHQLLRQHQQVFFSFDKEPMFFSKDEFFTNGLDWYSNKYFKNSAEYPIRAEASPHYLYWAGKVAQRIQQALPVASLKFIIILRNPIQRAYSWYWNMVVDGRENLSFMEALKAEEKRLIKHHSSLQSAGSMTYGYCRGGDYSSQIESYFEYFPRDQFCILLLEDLKWNFDTTMAEVIDFLEIDSKTTIETITANPSRMPRIPHLHRLIRNPSKIKSLFKGITPDRFRYNLKSLLLKENLKTQPYPEMDTAAYQYLRGRFSPEIKALSQLLQRDLSSWLSDGY